MNKTIRLKKGVRTTGIVCLLFFLSIGVFSVVGILLEPPPKARVDPTYLAIALGCFWSAMSSLAIWMLLAYWRERVIVSTDSVTQVGVFRTLTIQVDDVERVTWKAAPSRVCLHTVNSRIKIELSNLEVVDRLWLVRHVHQIPISAHEGWEMFCVKVAVPLRQCESAIGESLAPDKVALTRKRWAWYFLPTTILFAIVGAILAWAIPRPGMMAAPLPIICLWAYLHFSTPKQGLATTRISAEPARSAFLKFMLIWCGLGLVGNFLIAALKLSMPQVIAWYVGGGVLWFSVLMYKAIQFDRQREQNDEDRIPAALEEWAGDRGVDDVSR